MCLNKEFFRDLSMWRVFLTSCNRRSFFLDSFLTAAPDLELYTEPVQWDLRVTSMANCFKGDGLITYSLINYQGLVSSGRSSSLLSLHVPCGTHIFRENAFSFGAIMRALLQSLTWATPRLPGSWTSYNFSAHLHET